MFAKCRKPGCGGHDLRARPLPSPCGRQFWNKLAEVMSPEVGPMFGG